MSEIEKNDTSQSISQTDNIDTNDSTTKENSSKTSSTEVKEVVDTKVSEKSIQNVVSAEPIEASTKPIEASTKPKKVSSKKGSFINSKNQPPALGHLFTGKRKTAIARVKMVKGSGQITVNKRNLKDYFPRLLWQKIINSPLEITNNKNKFDISVNIYGSGLSAQSVAIRLGISRCINALYPEHHTTLRQAGFLTLDSRQVERKKYGFRKARRSVQFSKR